MLCLAVSCSRMGVDEDSKGKVPSVPENLSAKAEDEKVVLQWDEKKSLTYTLYYSNETDVVSDFKSIKDVSSPYEHKKLENGKKYTYVLTASNSAGESEFSEVVEATPMGKISGTWEINKVSFEGDADILVKVESGGVEVDFIDTTVKVDTTLNTESKKYHLTLDEDGSYELKCVSFEFDEKKIQAAVAKILTGGSIDDVFKTLLNDGTEKGTWKYDNGKLKLKNSRGERVLEGFNPSEESTKPTEDIKEEGSIPLDITMIVKITRLDYDADVKAQYTLKKK